MLGEKIQNKLANDAEDFLSDNSLIAVIVLVVVLFLKWKNINDESLNNLTKKKDKPSTDKGGK